MKVFNRSQIDGMLISVILVLLFAGVSPLCADENYDPAKILQVPHQGILNNETLPGTSSNNGALDFTVPIKVAPGRNDLRTPTATVSP